MNVGGASWNFGRAQCFANGMLSVLFVGAIPRRYGPGPAKHVRQTPALEEGVLGFHQRSAAHMVVFISALYWNLGLMTNKNRHARVARFKPSQGHLPALKKIEHDTWRCSEWPHLGTLWAHSRQLPTTPPHIRQLSGCERKGGPLDVFRPRLFSKLFLEEKTIFDHQPEKETNLETKKLQLN